MSSYLCIVDSFLLPADTIAAGPVVAPGTRATLAPRFCQAPTKYEQNIMSVTGSPREIVRIERMSASAGSVSYEDLFKEIASIINPAPGPAPGPMAAPVPASSGPVAVEALLGPAPAPMVRPVSSIVITPLNRPGLESHGVRFRNDGQTLLHVQRGFCVRLEYVRHSNKWVVMSSICIAVCNISRR